MERAGKKTRRITLRVQLTVIFGGLVLLTVFAITFVNYYLFRSHLSEIAKNSLQTNGATAVLKVQNLFSPACHILNHLSGFGFLAQIKNGTPDFQKITQQFYTGLGVIPYETPQIYGIYMGLPNGSFIDLERGDQQFRKTAKVPEPNNHPFLRWHIDKNQEDPKDQVYYFDGTNWVLSESDYFDYDPRTRPWYKLALEADQPVWTDIYQYAMADILGITLSSKIAGKQGKTIGVIGIDILVDDLSRYLDNLHFSENGFAFIARNDGRIIAHSILLDQNRLKNDHVSEINLNNYHYDSGYDLDVFKAFVTRDKNLVLTDGKNEQLISMRINLLKAIGLDADLYIGAPVSDFTKFAVNTIYINLLISIALGLVMIYLSFAISKNVARPINKIVLLLERIRDFDFTIRPVTRYDHHILEIDRLQKAGVLMHDALQSFSRFVPSDLVKNLVQMDQPLGPGGKRMEVTILFTDIFNFTSISEESNEDELVEAMGEYLGLLSDIIYKHHGIVDKFIGDAVMAIWGAPAPDTGHVRHACRAVIDCVEELEKLNARWKAMGRSPFYTRFGIHCGITFVGNIGSPNRLNYTAIGDTVNIAARLETLNKEKGTSVLVSREVVEKCGNEFNFKDLGKTHVKGRQHNVHVFELYKKDSNKPSEK